ARAGGAREAAGEAGAERKAAQDGAAAARKGDRPAYFPETGFVPTPVYDRYRLAAGDRIPGPLIVEEREATTVVPPGWSLMVDGWRNLVIRREEAHGA
ncbi:MAG: hypothetical protein IRZ11_09260, partial [Clostridia bacterium]|nr:hypothetical protein [Clostridia bacterium]